MLKDRKRNYTAPLKITEEGKQQIQTREFVQSVQAQVSALIAMKVILAIDGRSVFEMMIAWAAAGNGLDSMPVFGDCSQLDRFAQKHHTELQKLTCNLTGSEMYEGYQRLLADCFAKDISEPSDPNGPWNGWLN